MSYPVRHEHKKFIDAILRKVMAHSRLVSTSNSFHADKPKYRVGFDEEAKATIEDIEYSLYLKLDEMGEDLRRFQDLL
tara:strand:- start:299 stop:532 length:234 start_codon:yes stop_codon:yes gene_type:complete